MDHSKCIKKVLLTLMLSVLCANTLVCEKIDAETQKKFGSPTAYVMQNLIESRPVYWLWGSPWTTDLADGAEIHTIQRDRTDHFGFFDTSRKKDMVEIVSYLHTHLKDRPATAGDARMMKEVWERSIKEGGKLQSEHVENKITEEKDGYTVCTCTRIDTLKKGRGNKLGMLSTLNDLPDGEIEKDVVVGVECTTKMSYETFKKIVNSIHRSRKSESLD